MPKIMRPTGYKEEHQHRLMKIEVELLLTELKIKKLVQGYNEEHTHKVMEVEVELILTELRINKLIQKRERLNRVRRQLFP